MTYFILLIIIPLLAWFSGRLSQKTEVNFWFFFAPFLAIGFIVYHYGPKIFKK